jgi:hypothetical protein
MSNENDDIELSPGFFDLNDDDDNEEINKLVPDKIDVENDNDGDNDGDNDDDDDNNDNDDNKNVMIELFYIMAFNTKRSCACGDGAWTRIRTY